MKPHVLVVLVACARPAPPLAHHVASTATHADPIACPEMRLRDFAARFPEAKLEIRTETLPDVRGALELRCLPQESDDACMARAARQVPTRFVAIRYLEADSRSATVWYGYQPPRRAAKLVFPPTRVVFEADAIRTLERTLRLDDKGIAGMSRRSDPTVIWWTVEVTCE